MKKYIAFLLCLIMLISLVSCGETKNNTDLTSNTENQNKDIQDSDYSNKKTPTSLEIYKPVLEVYRLAVDELKELYSFVNANSQGSASELFGLEPSTEKEWFLGIIDAIYFFYGGHGEEDKTSPHHKLSCGYAIKDLNGDGVDELVLLTDDYMVCAIFSITDGKPILLGNYRTRHSAWIDEKGWIHENGSSGADNSMNAVYKIADGGASMELIAEFGTNGHEWIGDTAYTKYYKLVNGEKVSITESEYSALNEQYTKYLGTHAGAEATKNYSNLTFISLYTEAEIAMEMYEAAINDEICVLDEHLGEIKLGAYRFPSDDLRFDECKILYKAILDMDGDEINEYIIQSPDKDHIVLHYYDGKVYSYCFDSKNFFNLNTDGSFYWIDSYEIDNCTRGYNQIAFEGSSFCIKELYRIKQTSPYDYGDNDHEYYVDGKQITREEFLDYYDSNCRSKARAIFSPLDISCEYPISSEKAFELASNYWGFKSGMDEGAAGTMIINKIVILEKPNNDTLSYHIGWQMEGYTNHVIDSWYGQPPSGVITYEELIVDAITGEVREYDNITSQPSESDIAMEMYEQTLSGLASYKTPYSGIPLCECGNLGYTYVDLDGDSINELIIDCGDTLILRYYEGTVYFYEFTFRSLYYLKTDGSYSWNHTGSDFEYGENQIYFEGATLKARELWRIVNDGEPDAEYYIENKKVTEEELLKYFEDNPKTRIEFSPLEASWINKISRYEAITIAENYWENLDIEENGYRVERAVNANAPDSVYVIVIKRFVLDHYSTFDEIWVEKNTGEAIVPYTPDGKD